MKFSIKISSVNVTKSEGNCRRKHLLLFEICTCEICEKFAYKHSETIEYVKTSLRFKKFTNFTGK